MTLMPVLIKLGIGMIAWQVAYRTQSVLVHRIALLWLVLGGVGMFLRLLAGFSVPVLLGGIVLFGLAWHARKYGPFPKL
jgi:Na+/proline symporter